MERQERRECPRHGVVTATATYEDELLTRTAFAKPILLKCPLCEAERDPRR